MKTKPRKKTPRKIAPPVSFDPTIFEECVLSQYHNPKTPQALIEAFEQWMTSRKMVVAQGGLRNWVEYLEGIFIQDYPESKCPLFETYIFHHPKFSTMPFGAIALCPPNDRRILQLYNIKKATGIWRLLMIADYCTPRCAAALIKAMDKFIANYVFFTDEYQEWVALSGDETAKILEDVGFQYEKEVIIHQPDFSGGKPSKRKVYRKKYPLVKNTSVASIGTNGVLGARNGQAKRQQG